MPNYITWTKPRNEQNDFELLAQFYVLSYQPVLEEKKKGSLPLVTLDRQYLNITTEDGRDASVTLVRKDKKDNSNWLVLVGLDPLPHEKQEVQYFLFMPEAATHVVSNQNVQKVLAPVPKIQNKRLFELDSLLDQSKSDQPKSINLSVELSNLFNQDQNRTVNPDYYKSNQLQLNRASKRFWRGVGIGFLAMVAIGVAVATGPFAPAVIGGVWAAMFVISIASGFIAAKLGSSYKEMEVGTIQRAISPNLFDTSKPVVTPNSTLVMKKGGIEVQANHNEAGAAPPPQAPPAPTLSVASHKSADKDPNPPKP